MCRTVSAEIDFTTPSRTNCRAISVQSHCDNERPSSSGRSQAILTTYIATSGGKDRLAAASGAIVQAVEATLEEPLDPLADMLLGQADQPGHGDQGEPSATSRIARHRRAKPSEVEGQRRRCSS